MTDSTPQKGTLHLMKMKSWGSSRHTCRRERSSTRGKQRTSVTPSSGRTVARTSTSCRWRLFRSSIAGCLAQPGRGPARSGELTRTSRPITGPRFPCWWSTWSWTSEHSTRRTKSHRRSSTISPCASIIAWYGSTRGRMGTAVTPGSRQICCCASGIVRGSRGVTRRVTDPAKMFAAATSARFGRRTVATSRPCEVSSEAEARARQRASISGTPPSTPRAPCSPGTAPRRAPRTAAAPPCGSARACPVPSRR